MPEVRIRRSLAVAVACTALCVFVARPAYAGPVEPNTTPSLTATPTPTPSTTLPPSTAPVSPFPAVTGPLASQILTEEAAVEALGQQVQALQQSVASDNVWTSQAFAKWQSAVIALNSAQDATTAAATQAYEKLDSLGPLQPYSTDIQQLGLVAPGLLGAPSAGNGTGTAVDLNQAKADETAAYQTYLNALTAQQTLQDQLDTQKTTYDTRSAALTKLIKDNKAAVDLATAAQNKYDTEYGSNLPISTNVKGQVANPKAIAAVNFALSQLGDPYVFGDEGPNTYDCSGLTWRSYRTAGVTIPRIARYQYHATTPISIQQLLPGDLVFFSTTSRTDWTQISHVGMYIGNGKMVEAPHTGDVVKIAPVWWSAFFGATRVVPAVAGPKSPSPTPSPTHSPSPSPTPSPTHSPSPSPSPSSSPSASPSTSPSSSPSASPSSSPSASPSTSPSSSPSSSPSASPSPSSTPSPSPSSPAPAPSSAPPPASTTPKPSESQSTASVPASPSGTGS